MLTEAGRKALHAYKVEHYPGLWRMMVDQMMEPGPDCCWLQGPANYLMRTGSVCWAVDLMFREHEIFTKLQQTLPADLDLLRFVLITHGHTDHFSKEQLAVLCKTGPRWIVPDFLWPQLVGLPQERFLRISAGQTMLIDGVAVTAFNGLHWDDGGRTGVPSLGYLVEAAGRRYLFCGDVREYTREKLPALPRIDCSFAHVWLGRGQALQPPWSPYLSRFCDFHASIGASKLLLTHLFDLARPLTDLWTYEHCGPILDALLLACPSMAVAIPRIGYPHFFDRPGSGMQARV